MRIICSFFLLLGTVSGLFSQNNFWTSKSPESYAMPEHVVRKIQPNKIATFQLDYPAFQSVLAKAPMEFSAEARKQPVFLSLPLANGSIHTFYITESPVMAPELMAAYPEIRTYSGQDVEGLGFNVRLGVGVNGMYAFFFGNDGSIQTVRPYADGMNDFYMSYRLEDLKGPNSESRLALCGVEATSEEGQFFAPQGQKSGLLGQEPMPVKLKKYRLAASAQAEYALFHGGTKASVMSAIVEAINFIVAIQERDWAVRLELVPKNDTLIYFDPDTDPFTGPLVPDWIGDNPAAINSRIGVNSYDIGHLFSRVVIQPGGVYVAGQAQLSGVCTQINKSVAGSSLPSPVGEEYYLIMAHEMGHQFSATHTFNNCPSSQDAQESGTAYEPGGGATIMAYATVCDPYDYGNRSGYYHVANLEQVDEFISNENGHNCAQFIDTGNHSPEVSIPLTNGFYIPVSTPFVLRANASDEDGDNLSYCWEEYDLGPVVPLGQPEGTTPIFRSFSPVSSPERTFPRLTNIITNVPSQTEVLPTYSRYLEFKVTVRDNHPGGGGVGVAGLNFRSTATAGPFLVTYPNTGSVVWNAGEYQTVTWDVANTNVAPVSCKKVNILLSTDNGFNYPITLAQGVPNIGRVCIQVPDVVTNNARVRVEAADNIFFDISNAKFKIQQPSAPHFSVCISRMQDLVCMPATYTQEINTAGLGGFTSPVGFVATGAPAGAVVDFSPNPVVAGSPSTLSISLPPNTPEGSFNLTVKSFAGSDTISSLISFSSVSNNFSTFGPISPTDGATGVSTQPLLTWSTAVDADSYDVELATNPSFSANTIVLSGSDIATGSFQVNIPLTEGGVFYWQVRPKTACGPAAWSDPQVFLVSVLSCVETQANDLPKAVSANGTPTVESKINILAGGQISEIAVKKVQGNHQFFKDLEAHLIGPSGTDVLLWKEKCGNYNGSFNIRFSDGATAAFTCPPPNNNSNAKPAGSLNSFVGQNMQGVWTLRVKDNSPSSGGSISGFELRICSNQATTPPIITVNNPLHLTPGGNAGIDASYLKAEDANNGAGQLTFTLVTTPQHGSLRLYGNEVVVGTQFTQLDINNGALHYFDYGQNAGVDAFRFVVSDGEGGMAGGVFTISPLVGTKDPTNALDFVLAPNPASDLLHFSLSRPLDSNAMILMYNAAGQRVRSWSLAAGASAITMHIADLPEGVYAVAVENAAVRGIKKVVIR